MPLRRAAYAVHPGSGDPVKPRPHTSPVCDCPHCEEWDRRQLTAFRGIDNVDTGTDYSLGCDPFTVEIPGLSDAQSALIQGSIEWVDDLMCRVVLNSSDPTDAERMAEERKAHPMMMVDTSTGEVSLVNDDGTTEPIPRKP